MAAPALAQSRYGPRNERIVDLALAGASGTPLAADQAGRSSIGGDVLDPAGTFAAWVISLGPLPLAEARKVSTTIVDRHGKLLRAYAMADGRWRLPVDARTAVDPGYLKLLLAYEDRRFYSHAGVDPLGARACRPFNS